ncbi:MAG: DUF5127 domain-containing protein, partial [Terriglobales bacterium]
MRWTLLPALGLLGFLGTALAAQSATLRPPAVPLILHDPGFSIWMMGDTLTSGPTRHWTGVPQPLNGLIRIDGTTYRWLGNDRGVPALPQQSLTVTPTRTIAGLANAAIELQVTFLNPALPRDLATLARPVTYLSWSARSLDGNPHAVTLYLDASGALAVNDNSQPVVWGRDQVPGLDLLRIGTRDQRVLERFGDNVRMDWGWFYLGLPRTQPHESVAGNQTCRAAFAATGHLPQGDDLAQPRAPAQHYPPAPLLCVVLPLGTVAEAPVSRHVLLAYDEIYPIEYMQR